MKLLAVIILMLACVCAARAQTYKLLTLATNAIPNAATNSTAGTSVDIGLQTNVTVFAFGNAQTNSGTGTITLTFQGSPDDSTYFANSYALTLAVNGTNTVSNFARFDTTPFRYLKHTSTGNPTTNVFTNIVVYMLLK